MNRFILGLSALSLGCVVAVRDEPSCPSGQVVTYAQGCPAPAPVCAANTSGDAIALTFCGCDGVDHTTSQWPPSRPWRAQGSCAPDGGADAATPPPACASGQVLTYAQGCYAPAPMCAPDTSGDAIAIAFCGCDGVTRTTSQWPPTRPWRVRGDCSSDGGVDASSDAAPFVCPLPPIGFTACNTDSDCTTYSPGCYCGRQPVNGTSVSNAPWVRYCEDQASRSCAFGCAVMEGLVAQDGRTVPPGGSASVRCVRAAGSPFGNCTTYVP